MIAPSPDHLGDLKKKLYSRTGGVPQLRRSPLGAEDGRWTRDWLPSALSPRRSFWRVAVLKWLLIAALIFFVLMAGVTVYIFRGGYNIVSAENVEMTVDGPLAVRAGDEAAFQISLINKNDTPLQYAVLNIEYPPGTHRPGGDEVDDTELSRERLDVGTITPGGLVNRTVRALLFGEKDSHLTLRASLEYRLPASSAIFNKEKSYDVAISDAPVALVVKLPAEANAGQSITLETEIVPNATSVLRRPAVLLTYPPGFVFTRANPAPSRGNNFWELDNLAAGEKTTITVTGVVNGQTDEAKVFRTQIGSPDPADDGQLKTVYSSAVQTLTVRRPSVALGAAINSADDQEYLAGNKENLRLEINWLNNLPTEITGGEISVAFTGAVLDPTSVAVERGFYQSDHNLAVWNQDSLAELRRLAPGGTGRAVLSFTNQTLAANNAAALKNPQIGLLIKFRGQRTTPAGANEPVNAEVNRTIKINSVLQLAAKVIYHNSVLPTSGPLPPKVGEETTYTIVWSVVNSSNDIANAMVRAVLPPYIRWLQVQTPTNEVLRFSPRGGPLAAASSSEIVVASDQGGGEVIWELGMVSAGTGFTLPPREVAFQVGLTPSLSQVGSAPVILEAPVLTGLDTFTKQTLTSTSRRPLDTYLISDPSFRFGEDRVAR